MFNDFKQMALFVKITQTIAKIVCFSFDFKAFNTENHKELYHKKTKTTCTISTFLSWL
jgi:adenine-specific DNA methylase